MAFDPAKPRYTLPLAGKDYELEGSFALIEAAEYALKDNIVSIGMRCIELPVHEMARLLAAILPAGDSKLSLKEVGEILWGMGFSSPEYSLLCLHVHAFLRICMAKPSEREAVKKNMGEILGEVSGQSPSPGVTTSNSASES